MVLKLFILIGLVFSLSVQAQMMIPEGVVSFLETSILPKKLQEQVSYAAAMGCNKTLSAPDVRELRTTGQATALGDSWGYPLNYRTVVVFTVWDADKYNSHNEYVVVDSVEISDVQAKVVTSTGCTAILK